VPQLQAAADLGAFDEIVPISAGSGRGLDVLLRLLVERLPEGPPLYPPGEVTDQPLEVRVAELVREQALQTMREELPHSVAVVVEDLEEEGSSVTATIAVERDSRRHRDRRGSMLERRVAGASKSRNSSKPRPSRSA
jgi:GTP-binding protein Era